MSGQAIEAGLVVAVVAFQQQTGNNVKITYATTPQMRQRIGGGETPDVVIAPPALLDEVEQGAEGGIAAAPVLVVAPIVSALR